MNRDKERPKLPAWDAALKLLAGRDFSASEMLARLARRGYDEDESEGTVAKLMQLGYVVETGSDRDKLCEMARDYLVKKNKTEITASALRSLEAFLLRKGFEAEIVEEYLRLLAEMEDDNKEQSTYMI